MNINIRKLFLKKLGYNVLSIKDSSKGVDQNVKIVSTNNGIYVIKIPHKEKDKIVKEVVATRECQRLKIPVPNVIFYNNDILIETYIEGKSLDEIKTTKEKYSQIYRNLGRMLRKIHSKNCSGFGSIVSENFQGKYTTQKQSIDSYIIKELERLKKSKFYSETDFRKIMHYYKDKFKFLKVKNSVLLHSDFEEPNILIKNNKSITIIDFGDLSAGSAMQDLSRIYYNNYDTYKFNEFLKGYGKHDLEEIKFHTYCFLTWRINGCIYGNKIKKDKQFQKMLTIYRNIWN